jgi:sugar lactone lactonase YvrE
MGSSALFNSPYGIAVDASGTVYVADSNNNNIRAILSNQTVLTLAGGFSSGNQSGSVNGMSTRALFNFPRGIAVDASGTVYVADFNNNKIRAILSNQTVITLAGGGSSGTLSGSVNGMGSSALFNSPSCVAVDTSGTVYVADYGNHKIRAIYPPVSCPPGSYIVAPSCAQCPAGTFSSAADSPSCQQCAGGHYCPAGTSSWARLNCGRGNYCTDGSAAPTPCPFQVPPSGGWAHLQVQGPAFLVETAHCLNHCYWNFTSGDGLLSKC